MAPWTPIPLPADVVALTGVEATAYVGLSDGRVLRTGPDGDWATVAEAGAPPRALLAVPGGLLLATDAGLRRFVGGRLVPTDQPPESVVALALADGVAVAGTLDRGVFRSEDGGASWTASNEGLPFRGVGLAASSLAITADRVLVGHGLGVSQSRDAGLHWETAGAGLPVPCGPLSIAASGVWAYAEAGGRLFRLDGETWVERGGPAVALLGADAHALYGVDAGRRLVWRSAMPGADWTLFDEGLPPGPVAVTAAAAWRLAAVETGALWRRPTSAPPPVSAAPSLGPVPPFWTGGPAEVGFHLPAPAYVVLALDGANGREAARLADRSFAAGSHVVPLAAAGLPAGLYQCRLTAGAFVTSRPLAVLGA